MNYLKNTKLLFFTLVLSMSFNSLFAQNRTKVEKIKMISPEESARDAINFEEEAASEISDKDSANVEESLNLSLLSLQWFDDLNDLDVSALNDKSVVEILDTINYNVLSNAQIDSLNIRIEKLKNRYIDKYGSFPLIYPTTEIWIPQMGCNKCSKDVTTTLLIETKIVKKVKSIDVQSDLVAFTYDTAFVAKEDSMLTILGGKLKMLGYIIHSMDDANNPDLMMKATSSMSTEGVLECPIHGHASQESLFPYGETPEDMAGDPAWEVGDTTQVRDTTDPDIPVPNGPDADKPRKEDK